MDETTRVHALDPFFTTKASGRGTGLGLPMAARVARTAGGTLTIESKPGEGSTIALLMPAVDAEPVEAEPATDSTSSPRGDETILVVDDDPLVLRFADRALRRLGYSVIATTSGEKALAAAAERPEIAAAVLDVVMPAMGGQELATLLRQTRPGLPICFISAHSDRRRADVLWKPFTEAELAREVRGAIDATVYPSPR
jgi:CheY-like chemotaxis protein